MTDVEEQNEETPEEREERHLKEAREQQEAADERNKLEDEAEYVTPEQAESDKAERPAFAREADGEERSEEQSGEASKQES